MEKLGIATRRKGTEKRRLGMQWICAEKWRLDGQRNSRELIGNGRALQRTDALRNGKAWICKKESGFIMKTFTQSEIKRFKLQYPEGTNVKMVSMDDLYVTIPMGTVGVVENVDDIGTIHVKWENGVRLGLIPGVDSFEVA